MPSVQDFLHGAVYRMPHCKVYCPECLRLATDMRDFMIEIVESMKEEKKKKAGNSKKNKSAVEE